MEHVVLPAAVDLEVSRGESEPGEAVARQNALRSHVVGQRAGLDAVKSELAEGNLQDAPDRRRGMAAAGVVLV